MAEGFRSYESRDICFVDGGWKWQIHGTVFDMHTAKSNLQHAFDLLKGVLVPLVVTARTESSMWKYQ